MAKSPQSGQSGSVKAYLILYNSLSAAAWSLVLGRTLSTWMEQGFQSVYAEAGQLTRLVQSMALLEVLHSMFGMQAFQTNPTTRRHRPGPSPPFASPRRAKLAHERSALC